MRDKRFIIIKINSNNIAYSVIDCSSISFYDNSGKQIRDIKLDKMLEEIIDIPTYFEVLFEKGMEAVSYLAETESLDLQDYMQTAMPFMNVPPGITRCGNSEILRSFDLDNEGTVLTIIIVPRPVGLYYDFTITQYNRLIMDIIINPADMLFVDVGKRMHTLEIGHIEREYDPMYILEFLHPKGLPVNRGNNKPGVMVL